MLNAARRSMTFSTYLRSFAKHKYNVQRANYEEHVLLLLFHLVVNDLSTNSRSPALDDGNTEALLERVRDDGSDSEASYGS